MSWTNGDKVAKGSRLSKIEQSNSGTKTVRCSLVDPSGKVWWHADITPGATVKWSTYPAWEAPDDLTVNIS